MRAIWLALGLTTTGCAVRAAPYRFAGPMVSAVSLDDVAEHGRTRSYDDAIYPGGDVRIVDLPGAPGRADVPATASVEEDGSWRVVAEDLMGDGTGGVIISRLPARHHEKKPKAGVALVELDAVSEAADLRDLVGRRDGRTDTAFAIAAATKLGGAPPAKIAALTDGPALVEAAADALVSDSPHVGDLLIFDRAEDDLPASRVAIVIAQDARGVYEMIYLSHGVVRRGFVDPARPSTKRDADGKVVNTFLRDGDDYPPKGTKYLAGELLAHVLVWSRL